MPEPDRLIAVSYGGGVQSTAIAHLVINRHPDLMRVIDRLPDCFIFADTGDEPDSVYETVERTRVALDEAGIPLYVVKKSERSLSEDLKKKVTDGNRGIDCPPFFLDTGGDKEGKVSRQCTYAWKVEVLDRKKKKLFGLNLRKKDHRLLDNVVDAWMGISLDEAQRMRTSKDKWQRYVYPLIDMRWRRSDCIKYLEEICVKASRSACTYCPFHSDQEWVRLKREEPEAWKHAVEFEAWVHAAHDSGKNIAGLDGKPYLHRTLVPISDAIAKAKDSADQQADLFGWDAFSDECAGVCGV